MNQIKIAEFIQALRKEKNLTQADLAESLGITDRAVSKWERGKSLPDASLMLQLCDILGITVNELLNGEKIDMENYDKKTEELLIKLAKAEEEKNKALMLAMWTLMIVSIVALLAALTAANLFMKEGPLQLVVILSATVIFLIPCFIALKLEVKAGYYECRNCHHKFVPTYKEALNAMHMGTTRYLKCPECNKRTWCKKVLKK
jgi:transcriptional regulator with XRE-family HTH domain/DNA-directed RNA polymerase subunit RPC12/RpoP